MKIQSNISLKDYTTFKIGGKAEYFCVARSLNDLKEACLWAEAESLQTFILGGGSNILFSDDGFEGLVIKLENDNLVKIEENDEKVVLNCGAGIVLADLVKYCVENGLEGLEWAAGIPGTFGGAVRGNAGAFGLETGRLVKEVKIIKKVEDKFQEEILERDACDFGYRNSFVKKNKNLILWEVVIELQKGDKEEVEKSFREYIKKRQKIQPVLGKFPSIGSIFKNPQASKKVIEIFEEEKNTKVREGKVPAGWLIDRCDLKGKKVGGAMVSEVQANFIVNTGGATSDDVIILMSLIKQKVRGKFGIQLEAEVEVVI